MYSNYSGTAEVRFFFQAEDGIRDWSVTGVQTCALPICGPELRRRREPAESDDRRDVEEHDVPQPHHPRQRRRAADRDAARSEERRVGKECRMWMSPLHENNTYSLGIRAQHHMCSYKSIT